MPMPAPASKPMPSPDAQGGPPPTGAGNPSAQGQGGGIGQAAEQIASGLQAFSQAFSADKSGVLSPTEHDLLAKTQASFEALMTALQAPAGQGLLEASDPAPGPMPFGSKPGAMPA